MKTTTATKVVNLKKGMTIVNEGDGARYRVKDVTVQDTSVSVMVATPFLVGDWEVSFHIETLVNVENV